MRINIIDPEFLKDRLRKATFTDPSRQPDVIERASKIVREALKSKAKDLAANLRKKGPPPLQTYEEKKSDIKRDASRNFSFGKRLGRVLPEGIRNRIPFLRSEKESKFPSPFTREFSNVINREKYSKEAAEKIKELQGLVNRTSMNSSEINGKNIVNLQLMMDTIHQVRFEERSKRIEEATSKISLVADLLNEIRIQDKEGNTERVNLLDHKDKLDKIREELGLEERVYIFDGTDNIDRLKTKLENLKAELQQTCSSELTYIDAQLKSNNFVTETLRNILQNLRDAIAHINRMTVR